jgi:TRAP-type mannitol/chloroaromatic compound transport system substrate-binding protein
LNINKNCIMSVVIIIITLFSFQAYGQKPAIWKMQTLWSAGELPYKILQDFCERVPVLTEGRLEILLFPAGAIVPTVETLGAVKFNILQVINVWPGYFSGKEPAFAPLSDFLCAYDEPWEYDAFFHYRGGLELLNELYEPYNAVTIGIIMWGRESMFIKYPVLKPEDFRGHKFRSPQGMTADMLNILGAGVVFLPGEEVYSALDKGVVDGADWATPSINHRMNFDRVAKYYIYPGFRSMPVSDFTINRDAWNKLPDDIKQILRTAVRELNWETIQKCAIDDFHAMKEMNASGSTPLVWKEEDIESIRDIAKKVWEDWAKKSPLSKKVIDAQKKWLQEIGRIQ